MSIGRSAHDGPEYERLLRQEQLILDVTERLVVALGTEGITQAELAQRLNRTPGYVSQVLGGGRNLTIRTIADIAEALSLRATFKLSAESREAILQHAHDVSLHSLEAQTWVYAEDDRSQEAPLRASGALAGTPLLEVPLE